MIMMKNQDLKKKEKKRKTKNWISMNQTQKTPDYSRCFLGGLETLYKVEGLNHYTNLPIYGLREIQNCQF